MKIEECSTFGDQLFNQPHERGVLVALPWHGVEGTMEWVRREDIVSIRPVDHCFNGRSWKTTVVMLSCGRSISTSLLASQVARLWLGEAASDLPEMA